MREARRTQDTLRETWLDLDHAKELEAMSRVLDENPKIAELVLQDLKAAGGSKQATRGTGGLSGDQVIRVLIIKQMNGFSYRELAFHLADSRSYQTFCRLGITDTVPTKSTLNANLKALRPATLEAINRLLLGWAEQAKVETGQTVRTDCTVVESNIHEPSDSELLWDCVRVLTRLLQQARDLLGASRVRFSNRQRRAKRRRKEIAYAKNAEQRQGPYRDLLQVTAEMYDRGIAVRSLLQSQEVLDELGLTESSAVKGVSNDLDRFLPLVSQVMDQTRRRVLEGQSVPVEEKIVSIFEDHTDIIRKDRRETLYGHKICLTGGASSMILDCQVLEGNPADSTLAKTMVDRQSEIYAHPPRQVVFDGGFASKMNLSEIKASGVEDVAFSKGRGLEIGDMVKSSWVYKRLRDFRAGIEGNISFLKRVFGLDRCTWKSWPSFQSYVWGSVVSFNLLVFARHLLS
jgi:transposase, IS5 family